MNLDHTRRIFATAGPSIDEVKNKLTEPGIEYNYVSQSFPILKWFPRMIEVCHSLR